MLAQYLRLRLSDAFLSLPDPPPKEGVDLVVIFTLVVADAVKYLANFYMLHTNDEVLVTLVHML